MNTQNLDVSHVQIFPYKGNFIGVNICYPNHSRETIDYWMGQVVQSLIHHNVPGITEQFQAYILTVYPVTGQAHLTVVNRKAVKEISTEEVFTIIRSAGEDISNVKNLCVVQCDYNPSHPLFVGGLDNIDERFGQLLGMIPEDDTVTVGTVLTTK